MHDIPVRGNRPALRGDLAVATIVCCRGRGSVGVAGRLRGHREGPFARMSCLWDGLEGLHLTP